MNGRRLRICLVASSRYPIREPFAGGLEAATHQLARELIRRGHQVSVFAAEGSDPDLPVTTLPVKAVRASDTARSDVGATSDVWLAEHHAYLGLMLDLARDGHERFDLVHNNSLHHMPVAMARALNIPMVTTLHTPPVPWLESAITLAPSASTFTAVSRYASNLWRETVFSTPILNGIDTERWAFGPGGGPAVWFGRLVPEKAPHDAMDAARQARLPLVLAGPAPDPGYFEGEVAPRLSADVVYVGHLDHQALTGLVRRAAVALVTPAWDEPYGLVAAEAMACGTPVAVYARGALPEFVPPAAGALVDAGDVSGLARAMRQALTRDRRAVRAHAVRCLSLERMVDDYERFYAELLSREAAA